jgi:putative cell wall-binding protein
VSDTVKSAVAALVGGADHVRRLGGSSRYDTARLVAAELASRTTLGGRVVVATGESYADALAAAPFAAYKHYPILLTRRSSLPAETSLALASMGASSTIVVGGTGAVSAAVEALLPSPERIAGASRYDTARRMAEYAGDNGCSFATVTIAAGTGFADALAGGPLAARNAGPVLLTAPTILSAEARACLEAHADVVSRVYILGGTGAVAEGVASALGALANGTTAAVWSEERRISQGLDYGSIPELGAASGPNGAVHVVWRENTSLLYRRLDRFGNTVVATVRLPARTSMLSAYGYPVVAPVPGDGAVVVWRVPTGAVPSLWALKLDEAGRVQVPPKRIYTGSGSYEGGMTQFLKAACDEKGRVHVVSRDIDDRIIYGIFDVRTLAAKLAMTPIVSPAAYELCEVPALTVWPGGSADVLWFDHRDWGVSTLWYQIYRSRFSYGAGTGPYPPGPASLDQKKTTQRAGGYSIGHAPDDGPQDDREPALLFEPGGQAQLVWMDTTSRIHWMRLDAAGDPLSAERLVEYPAVGPSAIRRVRASLRDDLSMDVLSGKYFSASGGFTGGVRLSQMRLDSNGTTIVPPARIVQATQVLRDFWVARAGDLDHRQLVYNGPGGGSGVDRVYYLDTARNPEANDRARCDLVVDDAHSADDHGPYREGQGARITVQVTNAGYVASPATKVRISKGTTMVAEVPVPALAVDATRSVTATWTVPVDNKESTARFTVDVDPVHAVAETAETNNTIDHPVALQVRPTGTDVVLEPLDETFDETRVTRGWDVDHYHASLSGTASETALPVSRSVDVTDSVRPLRAFTNVPPGVYTVTYSAAGFAPAVPSMTVTVTRDPANPYAISCLPSNPVELWLNTWGSITVRVYDIGGPEPYPLLPGPRLTVAELGRSVVATTGVYTFTKVPAGRYRVTMSADGHERITNGAAVVTVGLDPNVSLNTNATANGYVDVTVTDTEGGALAGAPVVLHGASEAIVGSALADADGKASFTAPAGVAYHVHATGPVHVAQQAALGTLVAGRTYERTFVLALDPALVSRASCDYSKWCISSDFYSIGGNDWYGFYRCFATRFGVDYTLSGGTYTVKTLDADVQAWPFMVTLLTIPVDWEVVEGGPFGFGSYPVPWSTPDRSNVKVEAVKLVDATTGVELWPSASQTPWYSHDGAGDTMRKGFSVPGVAMDSAGWSKLEVRMWVRVQKVGGVGPPYWETSPLGDSDGKAVIVYKPSDGSQRIVPWLVDP